MDVLQIIVVMAVLVLLVKPLGTYVYHVFRNEPNRTDKWFMWAEKPIFALIGLKERKGMRWKTYGLSFLLTNIVMVAVSYALLRLQYWLPLNPNGIDNMEETLTLNTVISFMTNTNLQHYSGETGLSYFSQMAVITMMMFTSAATGLCVAMAFVRGITGKGRTIGNFFEDFVKAHTRIFLPLAFIVTLLLVAFQVPQTLQPTISVTGLEGQEQHIAIGPVASLESIKHLGTNGGGFFGVNSAHPFENPNGATNVIEILSMWMLAAALPYAYGLFAKSRKQGWVIFSAMMILFVVFLSLVYVSESNGNPALNRLGIDASQGSMEGKEVRFGIAQSALFTTVTTAATTGTVNNMHDTLTPLGSITPFALMMVWRQRRRVGQYADVCDAGRVFMRADGRTNAGIFEAQNRGARNEADCRGDTGSPVHYLGADGDGARNGAGQSGHFEPGLPRHFAGAVRIYVVGGQ
ncbi:MAG: potassium transporter ATPase [Paenibacillus sp.]|nr:potassium transporter ATPase [Paenibacillus sp.]